MLSEQDKKDMLADARDESCRESFRQFCSLQEARHLTLDEYCDFCTSMASMTTEKLPRRRIHPTGRFLL